MQESFHIFLCEFGTYFNQTGGDREDKPRRFCSEAHLGSGKERNFNSAGVKLFQLFKFNRLQVCSCLM